MKNILETLEEQIKKRRNGIFDPSGKQFFIAGIITAAAAAFLLLSSSLRKKNVNEIRISNEFENMLGV